MLSQSAAIYEAYEETFLQDETNSMLLSKWYANRLPTVHGFYDKLKGSSHMVDGNDFKSFAVIYCRMSLIVPSED